MDAASLLALARDAAQQWFDPDGDPVTLAEYAAGPTGPASDVLPWHYGPAHAFVFDRSSDGSVNAMIQLGTAHHAGRRDPATAVLSAPLTPECVASPEALTRALLASAVITTQLCSDVSLDYMASLRGVDDDPEWYRYGKTSAEAREALLDALLYAASATKVAVDWCGWPSCGCPTEFHAECVRRDLPTSAPLTQEVAR